MTSPTQAGLAARSTKALAWGMGGAVGKVASQLLIQISLARLLDPVAFGQYAAVLTVVGFGYILAEGGFGSALIQKKEIISADIGLALGWSLLLGGVMALLINLLAPFLAHQFDDVSLIPVFRACAVLIPLLVLSSISSNLLRRELHMKGIQIINFFAYTVCFGGAATALAISGWGVWSLVAGFAAQTLFCVVATYSISKHTLRPRLKGDSALVHFGLKSLAVDIMNWSMDNLDRLIVGKFWGLNSLGLYSVAFNLSKAPTGLVISATNSIAFASTSRSQDNVPFIRKGFLTVVSAVALATIPIFTLVALESRLVLHVVYGEKWVAAAPYMAALASSIPWLSMGTITAAILRGTGNVEAQLRITMVAAVVLFCGFLIFHDASLAVAVWTVPFAYALRFLLLVNAIRNRIDLRLADIFLAFRGAFVLTVAGVCVTLLVRDYLHTTGRAMEVMPLLAGCCAIMLLLLFRLNWFLGAPLTTMVLGRVSAGRFGSVIARLAGEKQ